MKEATQQAVGMPEPPRLLLEWSSPWREFVSAIGPALHRSPKRLAGEARGALPFPFMASAWVMTAASLSAAYVLPGHLASVQHTTPLPLPMYDVLYIPGNEL